MKIARGFSAASIFICWMVLTGGVKAATVANPIVACKDEADAKKALGFLAKNDKPGLEKFTSSKIATRDCSSLSKGIPVTIDRKDGGFLCVRPSGELNCYWTSDVAINQNASEPQKSSSSRPEGQGRGGGHRQGL